MLYISKCYEVWDESAMEAGDTDDRGFEFKGEPYSFRELVEELRSNWRGAELSSTAEPDAHTWVTISFEDFGNRGVHTVHSLHLDRLNNNDRAEKYWVKALRAIK